MMQNHIYDAHSELKQFNMCWQISLVSDVTCCGDFIILKCYVNLCLLNHVKNDR
jgi:hypothetical protein